MSFNNLSVSSLNYTLLFMNGEDLWRGLTMCKKLQPFFLSALKKRMEEGDLLEWCTLKTGISVLSAIREWEYNRYDKTKRFYEFSVRVVRTPSQPEREAGHKAFCDWHDKVAPRREAVEKLLEGVLEKHFECTRGQEFYRVGFRYTQGTGNYVRGTLDTENAEKTRELFEPIWDLEKRLRDTKRGALT